MKNLFFLIISCILISCKSSTKTGIEGNNNSNNTVIIADKLEVPDENTLKYKLNYDITPEGVGGIKINQSIIEVQKFFKYNTDYVFEVDEGARGEPTDFSFPTIYVKDKENNTLFSILLGDTKSVSGFEVFSEKYSTYNGIHVGMSIEELSKIYLDKLILEEEILGDNEVFAPFDLQGDKVATIIYPTPNFSKLLKLPNKEYGSEANYSLDGKISAIDVHKYN